MKEGVEPSFYYEDNIEISKAEMVRGQYETVIFQEEIIQNDDL